MTKSYGTLCAKKKESDSVAGHFSFYWLLLSIFRKCFCCLIQTTSSDDKLRAREQFDGFTHTLFTHSSKRVENVCQKSSFAISGSSMQKKDWHKKSDSELVKEIIICPTRCDECHALLETALFFFALPHFGEDIFSEHFSCTKCKLCTWHTWEYGNTTATLFALHDEFLVRTRCANAWKWLY